MRNIRIAVLDDMRTVLEGTAAMLKSMKGFEVVRADDSPDDLLAEADWAEIDVVVTDYDFSWAKSDLDGASLCAQIGEVAPDVPVLMLTSVAKPDVLRRSIAAGAAGFVTKGVDTATLAHSIRQVAEGARPVFDAPASQMLWALQNPNGGATQLSPRRREVLQLLATHKSVPEIAAHMNLSGHTIHGHVRDLYAHFGVKCRTELLQEARTQGFLDVGNDAHSETSWS